MGYENVYENVERNDLCLTGRGKRGKFNENLSYSSFNEIFLISVGKYDTDFCH